MSGPYRFEQEQLVRRPVAEVFAWFSDPANLVGIMPPSMRFENLPPVPNPIREGAVLEHRMRPLLFPVRWRSVIEACDPPRRFVDVQARGPFRRWRHVHEFREAPGGTLIVDRVEYELPLGPLGSLAHALFVRRTLRSAFEHRRARLAATFPG